MWSCCLSMLFEFFVLISDESRLEQHPAVCTFDVYKALPIKSSRLFANKGYHLGCGIVMWRAVWNIGKTGYSLSDSSFPNVDLCDESNLFIIACRSCLPFFQIEKLRENGSTFQTDAWKWQKDAKWHLWVFLNQHMEHGETVPFFFLCKSG